MTTVPDTQSAPPPGQVSQVVEHLFRHEAGKIVSALVRIFGPANLSLAEDVVQEALVRAMQTWPYYGIPANPAAWIMQVSKNLAFDAVRRDKVFRDKEKVIADLSNPTTVDAPDVHLSSELDDDRLRMMFVCCHPVISPEAQVMLALKTLCGFGIGEIARAYLTNEDAVAKRLTRARQKIRDARVPFEIPAGNELSARLDAVLQTLYLLFNEGYKASTGKTLVREELCHEAIRMAEMLATHPSGDTEKTHALLALMLFNAARLTARTSEEGNLLRLKDQDRTRWDSAKIARGFYHMMQSGAGDQLSDYHLQAAIAACHCTASDYDSTDWHRILVLYDRLLEMDASPVIALNRAIALANVLGPAAGITAIAAIKDLNKLDDYYLLHAVLGEFEFQLNHREAAAKHFRNSLQLTEIKAEQTFLTEKLSAC